MHYFIIWSPNQEPFIALWSQDTKLSSTVIARHFQNTKIWIKTLKNQSRLTLVVAHVQFRQTCYNAWCGHRQRHAMKRCVGNGLNPIHLYWEKMVMIRKCISLSKENVFSIFKHHQKYEMNSALLGVLMYIAKMGINSPIFLHFEHNLSF